MTSEKTDWLDRPENIRLILRVFYACCIALLVLDLVLHRHVYHPWENLWGFYPIYGFVGCVVLVLIAKWMRTFLMRDENYYPDDASVSPGGNGETAKEGDDHVAG